MKLIIIILTNILLTSFVQCQNIKDASMTISQKRKVHYDSKFFLKTYSKKHYQLDSIQRIQKVIRYGRYHNRDLKLIGHITHYIYSDSSVIEIDSSYCCTDNSILNIIKDTISIVQFRNWLQFNTTKKVYNVNGDLAQSKVDSHHLKQFEYDKLGLLLRVKNLYIYDDNTTAVRSIVFFKYKINRSLSGDEIKNVNKILLWGHEME